MVMRLRNLPVLVVPALLVLASLPGTMPGPASVGGFKDGRGEFYDQEEWDGRTITFERFARDG
jgi:hypothetical protein